jgi:hypothetical protein
MTWHCEKHNRVLALRGVGYVCFAMSSATIVTSKSRNCSPEGFPGT